MNSKAVKERPILFSGPMVRAILEDRNTQTRRPVKPQAAILTPAMAAAFGVQRNAENQPVIPCPYGAPGDRLWVKETHRLLNCTCTETCRRPGMVYYEADMSGYQNAEFCKLRPSIHMPRWASRITLEITHVGVERLQQIDIDDIAHEGLQATEFMPPLNWQPIGGYIHGDDHEAVRDGWRRLWESVNGPESWAANPWVWVIEFKRIPNREI